MRSLIVLLGLAVLIATPVLANTPPEVTNVLAVQRPHTALVDVTFDIFDADGDLVNVTLWYSLDGGASWDNQCVTVSGNVGDGVVSGTGLAATWDAGTDAADLINEQFALRVYADDGGGSSNNQLPYPSNPDILMQNFERIYTEMRTDDFRNMLHTEYKTVLLPSTIAQWAQSGNPLTSDFFDRATEITIHENIFSGNVGLDPIGQTIPPIDSIQVDYIVKMGAWEPVPEADPVFGGLNGYWALFNILIYFTNPDQHRFEVRQDVEFYVVPVDDNGQTRWLLLGQRGHEPMNGNIIATESISLCFLKSLYR
jgi:hypothetical protein